MERQTRDWPAADGSTGDRSIDRDRACSRAPHTGRAVRGVRPASAFASTHHTTIAESIGRGDVAGAEAAMRTHLREILNDLPVIRASLPEYFDETWGA